MKTQELYEVWISAKGAKFNFSVRGFFDRIPTVKEVVEAVAYEYEENDAVRPGITLAVIDLLCRGGLPAPPPEFTPDVVSVLQYADGWVKVTRTRRFLPDGAASEAT